MAKGFWRRGGRGAPRRAPAPLPERVDNSQKEGMPDRLFRDRENAGHALAGLLDYYRDREGQREVLRSRARSGPLRAWGRRSGERCRPCVDPALHQDGGDVSVIPSDEISNS